MPNYYMQIKRHFLGWDGAIVKKVSGWLLEGKTGAGPVDFQDTLIVVPTLQAGRRLREVLALCCHERQSVLLSAAIVTPQHFFASSRADLKVANPALTMTVWTHVLKTVDLSKFSVFFPQPKRLDNIDRFQWALTTGEIIERLRQELADGGYSIADVIRKHESRLEELDRWKDMAGLEKLYLQKLNELGFSDSCNVKMSMADKPELEPGVTRIVLACAPDPTLLAIRALGNLSRDYSVDILIHAPETMANSFDDWGRPIPGVWVKEEVDIPGWDKNVFLEASPDTQGRRVVEILSGLPAGYGPADIGIGVPDAAVIPFLKKDLRAIHLSAFDPADAPFRGHSLGRLVDSMSNLLLTRAYLHVADLLRHPDFLRYLDASHKIAQSYLLTQLDKFQNYYLPVTLEEMLAPFSASGNGSSGSYDDFTTLGKALKIIKAHIDEFEDKPLEEAWRRFLQSVYDVRKINQDVAKDREFQQAAEIIEKTFREFRDVPVRKLGLDKRLSAVFVRRLQEQVFHRERADETLDLQGWLELSWTDTPFLVVTGLNEEFVPGGSLSDVFLPDSLRKILELRDDLSRFGRDVYLLKSLVESRRQNGRLCVIAGKYTLSGDPLRPSRLLFRCLASQLPGRAEQLFKTIEQAGRVPAAETIFQLKPAAAEKDTKILEDKVISVTAFSDYLTCPFRFYLKHVLKMRTLNDDKNELDALDFGTLVHKVLQIMGGDKDLWACRDAGRLGKKLAGLADQIMAGRYGANLPLAALVALSSARARLQALAREQVELAVAGWEIIATEQKKSLARNGFTITGKIDRIDRHQDSGTIRIIDYKTSDSDKAPQAEHLAICREGVVDYNRLTVKSKADKKGHVKETEKKWVNLQLPLYRLLYDDSNAFNPMFELAYFNLPKAISETGLSLWREFNNDMMTSAMHCVEGVLDDIARGIFWPPAERVQYDDDFEMLFLNSPDKAFDTEGFSS